MKSFALLSLLILPQAQAAAEPFFDPIHCEGRAVDNQKNEEIKIIFSLNQMNEETENSSFNLHRVTLDFPGFFGGRTTHNHANFHRDCYREGNVVTCSGIGVGTGEQEFKIRVNLAAGSASGTYDSTPYPSDEENAHFQFDSLVCR